MRKTEHMEVPFELKELDEATGTFTGYASVFGNVDLGGDVVEPGAFKRTLDHTKGAVPILWMHDASRPVGIGVSATEDVKGLAVSGQLDLDTQKGREVYSGLKMGYIGAMSIGYKAIGKEIKDGVRHLTELALPEYSLLTKGFAMNPEAAVEGVKVDEPDDLVDGFMSASEALAAVLTPAPPGDATVDDVKVGMVLSAANLEKVQAAVSALQAVLDAATPKSAPAVDPQSGAPDDGPHIDPAAVRMFLAGIEAELATLSL